MNENATVPTGVSRSTGAAIDGTAATRAANHSQVAAAGTARIRDIVMMYNLAGDREATLIYLTLYSPDQNPIELVFSKVN